jgi:thiol-disulfide isomerase/thioredoxin
MSRAAQVTLFVVVALLAGVTGHLLGTSNRPGVADAESILAATLPDLAGTPQTIGNWKGKVLVVNFWATWCLPCLEEIPHFVRMQRRLGGRGLQFVGIAIDDRDKVRAFARAHEINYPIVVGQLAAIELSKVAGNKRGGLPYTLVLDRSGHVFSQHYGGLSEETLGPIVANLL